MGLDRDTAITWLGHAAFVIDTPGNKRLIIDPWLTENPSCPEDRKDVGRVDAVLVTHGHFDHSGDAVGVANASSCPILGTVELCAGLEGRGAAQTTGFNLGGTVEAAGVKVTMVKAEHTSSLTGSDGLPVYAGVPVGYVIEVENGFRIYHAGDTGLFGDMTLIGELYRPDLALLPIGDHFTMGPAHAARACRMLGVAHAVPMHFGTFPLLTQSADSFVEAAGAIDGLTIHVLEPGETLR